MRTYHLTFNLEADGAWYIEFPGYPFAHHNLMMVAGADKLCQYIAEKEGNPNMAVVDVTTGNNFLQGRMPDIVMERYEKGYGARYHNTTPEGIAPAVNVGEGKIDVTDAWICPVTLLVLHGYPKRINIYIPSAIMRTIKHKETITKATTKDMETKPFETITPKELGMLDMVIAFDTTGSMRAYIGAVRQEVADLIPRLFKDNPDLRLGIVAFGDYCDMPNAKEFGNAYQCIMPTDNKNELIRFIKESKNTSGGDGDEFYELVIKKIVEETPWRKDAQKSILLIADSVPHDLGYTYRDIIQNNNIDWRVEGRKAAEQKIKIDTVTITDALWFKELSAMTNGTSVPFRSGYKTGRLVEAAVYAKGSRKSRAFFDMMEAECVDEEMKEVYSSYRKEREEFDG